MPGSDVHGARGEIEVTEADDAYLVKIHPDERHRAKSIVGRTWDWQRKRWVYPKTVSCFEALTGEFAGDAAVFEITEPRTPFDQRAADQSAYDPTVEDWRDPPAFAQLVAGSIAALAAVVEGIEVSTSQMLEMMEDSQEKVPHGDNSGQSNGVGGDRAALEAGVKEMALGAAGDDPSFRDWLSGVRPILDPSRFVLGTHEMLESALLEFGGDPVDARVPFGKVVADLRDNDLLPRRPFNVPQALFAMNEHRNWVAHPPAASRESELTVRSLIYLLNLALTWKLVSTPVDDL